MENIISLFKNNRDIQDVIDKSKNKSFKINLQNSTDNHNCLLAASLFEESDNFIFYIASNVYKATKIYDMAVKVLGYENVCLYISNEIVATEVDAVNKEFLYERLSTISSIIKGDKKLIICDVNTVLKEQMPFSKIKENIIHIEKGKDLDRKDLVLRLIKLGYRKVPTSNVVGDFSVRGEVIDIFPINSLNPIRIDLFDTEVEKIRLYDKDSQISIKNSSLNQIDIYPVTELIIDNPYEVASKIKTNNYSILEDLNYITNYTYTDRIKKYIHYMYDKTESVLDYCSNKIIIYEDSTYLKESYQKSIDELLYYYSSKTDYKELDLAYYFDFFYIFDYNKTILTSYFTNQAVEFDIEKYETINIEGYSVVNYQNNIKLFLEELRSGSKYLLTFSKEEYYNLMKEVLSSNNISFKENSLTGQVNICLNENSISFGFFNGLTVIDEANIYKKASSKSVKYRSTKDQTTLINSKDDLKPGDYIVHFEYGIGQYQGIKTMKTGDTINDYISIRFANVDLFIPVENINLLEKYQGEEGYVPKLTNIGTKEWEKKKQSIKEKLLNIARDLILLQAYRDTKLGYKYEIDNEIQEAFEADFEYQETKDQDEIIKTIKNEMEEGKIIDRLVCGDVGYGKTEIAIRIAMKTVLNGKQVAYLAPTTILTRQHYYTFKERMEKYGVRVELFNRLISIKEKNQILKDLSLGKVDVIIGTHALLSDDVRFKDLGLLIVDEEQRFGVTHKEKIKQYKNNINVLTLTATPIPRTLQMAIMGTRQMSLMETPPANRYPIQTYVLEENDAIIREAIYNELGRGGQVFYLHNRVDDIEIKRNKLRKLVPEARIIIAHGQMTKIQLENAIQAFIDHDYDILLCTTIIETGIDIPNTNTLIIEKADRLGLAQMYQIRGRVGRTKRVSYAYFMYDASTLLTQEGKQRLQAIKEFTSLGSGYKIAVRDLAIRGAGDFLGKEQSGYIDAVGMDLYMRLLNDSINEVKGIEKPPKKEKTNYIEVSKHVDDSYVSDDDIKIYIHKEIDSIDSKEKMKEVKEKLTDRFGKLNDEIILYINKKYFDSLLNKFDIEDVNENDFKVKIAFTKEQSEKMDAKKLMKSVYEMGEDYSIEYRNKRFIIYVIKLVKGHGWIYNTIELLEKLSK